MRALVLSSGGVDSTTCLGLAIEKYGKESFTFEILGYFENYNEVEKEMIQKYNCITPNGYNIQAGGEEPQPTVPENI